MNFRRLLLASAAVAVLLSACKKDDRSDTSVSDAEAMQQQLDSLRMVNDQLQLTQLAASIDSLPNYSEMSGMELNDDQRELLQKYNDARNKIDGLMAEIRQLRSDRTTDKNELKKRDEKIKSLEAEIATLKDIARSLYEQLADLNQKYEEEVKKNTELTAHNEELRSQVGETRASNEKLQQKVAVAERLSLTGVSLSAYNKKGKREKKVSKASQLGVSFTITPNNTAAPGKKEVYVRIKSPEGTLLPGGGNFSFDGTSLQCTAKRSIEYANEELPVSVYWDVTTSLTPGEYTVEIFCDGNRLATRKFTLSK